VAGRVFPCENRGKGSSVDLGTRGKRQVGSEVCWPVARGSGRAEQYISTTTEVLFKRYIGGKRLHRPDHPDAHTERNRNKLSWKKEAITKDRIPFKKSGPGSDPFPTKPSLSQDHIPHRKRALRTREKGKTYNSAEIFRVVCKKGPANPGPGREKGSTSGRG